MFFGVDVNYEQPKEISKQILEERNKERKVHFSRCGILQGQMYGNSIKYTFLRFIFQ